MSFINECQEWLKPHGYELLCHDKPKEVLTFGHQQFESLHPVITCTNTLGSKEFTLRSSLGLCVGVVSGPYRIKHTDTGLLIAVMKHYAEVCFNNNPYGGLEQTLNDCTDLI